MLIEFNLFNGIIVVIDINYVKLCLLCEWCVEELVKIIDLRWIGLVGEYLIEYKVFNFGVILNLKV